MDEQAGWVRNVRLRLIWADRAGVAAYYEVYCRKCQQESNLDLHQHLQCIPHTAPIAHCTCTRTSNYTSTYTCTSTCTMHTAPTPAPTFHTYICARTSTHTYLHLHPHSTPLHTRTLLTPPPSHRAALRIAGTAQHRTSLAYVIPSIHRIASHRRSRLAICLAFPSFPFPFPSLASSVVRAGRGGW